MKTKCILQYEVQNINLNSTLTRLFSFRDEMFEFYSEIYLSIRLSTFLKLSIQLSHAKPTTYIEPNGLTPEKFSGMTDTNIPKNICMW